MKVVIPDDYQDAVRHLECFGKLAGHDVTIHSDTVQEPTVDDPLFTLENVLATPHLGYVERDSYELYFGQAFDAVNAYALEYR